MSALENLSHHRFLNIFSAWVIMEQWISKEGFLEFVISLRDLAPSDFGDYKTTDI